MTEHYELDETLQSLGVGEAVVTVLDPRGVPTPVAATRVFPPASRMAPLSDDERKALVAASPLMARYATRVDRESAEEILAARASGDREAQQVAVERARPAPARKAQPASDDTLAGQVMALMTSKMARDIGKQVVRGIFGMMKR